MFERVADLFRKKQFIEAVGETTEPSNLVKYLCWVKVPDGRVGYVHHYKTDGKFGVRPVYFESGRHYPNPSQHWSNEDRLKHPEELALELSEIRPAAQAEIPAQYRRGV